jgi:hypothetical protein
MSCGPENEELELASIVDENERTMTPSIDIRIGKGSAMCYKPTGLRLVAFLLLTDKQYFALS